MEYSGKGYNYNLNGDLDYKGLPTGEVSEISEYFQYDVFGNLSQYNGRTNISYEVDPFLRRLGKKVNGVLKQRYVYNPEGQLIGELEGTNKLVKTFVYATKGHAPDYYIDASNNKFRIITDHLGSVRVLIAVNSGRVTKIMEHDEFGQVLQDTRPGFLPFGFAGGIYEKETGLVRFGVRDYDPETGRWLSKDPIRFNGGDTNLYGYVIQDPINNIDPPGTGPISGGVCYLLDFGYNASQASAEFINQTKIAGIYDQQIRNIQNQMNSSNSCAADNTRLQGEITVLQQQKNAALAQATNSLIGSIGSTVGGGIVCKGVSSLPGI